MGPGTQAVNGGCSLTQLKDKDTQECTHTRTPGTLDELRWTERGPIPKQTERVCCQPPQNQRTTTYCRNQIIRLTRCLIGVRHHFKYFIYIKSLTPHNKPVREALALSPFHRGVN